MLQSTRVQGALEGRVRRTRGVGGIVDSARTAKTATSCNDRTIKQREQRDYKNN